MHKKSIAKGFCGAFLMHRKLRDPYTAVLKCNLDFKNNDRRQEGSGAPAFLQKISTKDEICGIIEKSRRGKTV